MSDWQTTESAPKDGTEILGRGIEKTVGSIASAIMAERKRLTGSPELNGVFRHVKTGGTYHVAALCYIEATATPAVAYVSHKDGSVWVHPLAEFTDGRFEKVDAAAIRKDGRVMHPIDRQNQSAMNLKAGMCDCFRCIRERGDIRLRMGSCACGNKRCPKSSDHRLECTGSNEPGQEGSIFKKVTP